DLQTGWKFAAATVPGAVLGSQAASFFSDRSFQTAFGCLMLAVSLLMWYRKGSDGSYRGEGAEEKPERRGGVTRVIVDAEGIEFRYRFNLLLGIGFSLGVGFISSIMGIGGGIIHVPLLVLVLGFPPHLAASTSLFVLGWSSLVGSVTHFLLGHTDPGCAAALALGGLLGAQVGIRIASRLPGELIVKVFSLMMAAVGLRLIV
ncbi:MAG: sulfite exporter TauE/SafE family protein, partial [Syntrophomonadaceae bacterium]|nr:sulfite exporter TauE/SafE family protein [Syntrophomonadaceae bacterium]